MKIFGLLIFSISVWLSWLHGIDACSVYKRFEEVGNEVGNNIRTQLIFPGTKWCGSGNISSGYDDLGSAVKTDKCCREHDYCNDVIEAGQSKHNLTNNCFYSRLSCDCDQTFYDCLKKNNDTTSDELGVVYFDILNTQCFKKDYPIIRCKQHNKLIKSKCESYLLDDKKPKRWQWFDVPFF